MRLIKKTLKPILNKTEPSSPPEILTATVEPENTQSLPAYASTPPTTSELEDQTSDFTPQPHEHLRPMIQGERIMSISLVYSQ